jgi:endonuclease/exonuclease/phosphatase family metal-dependent hydrolase
MLSLRNRLALLLLSLLSVGPAFAQAPQAPAANSPSGKDPAPPLVVMSFNIRYGTANDGENAWPRRQRMVIERLRANVADVVGLQEALRFQIDEILAALPEYKAVGVGRDDGKESGEHAAILYRHARLELEPPVPHSAGSSRLTHGHFWLSDTPEEPGSKSWGNNITRMCTWVRLRETGTANAFVVFNTHLDHQSQASREKSVVLLKQQIAAREGGDPVIVTGDFNAGEDNPAIVTMLEADKPESAATRTCPPFRDSFRVVHPDEREVGTFNNFKANPPFKGDKIDYIFVDDKWEVIEASIDRTMPDGRCPSDHFPIIAKLRFRPATPQVPAEPVAPKP